MTIVFNHIKRELKFVLRDQAYGLWLVMVLILSSLSVGFGLLAVQQQQQTIEQLITADEQDRAAESAKLKDWGSAAYYQFHLTYAPPGDFAFAAMGRRDLDPWKHRVRMLALEGQIYERDVINPVIAAVGRFDFAFLATLVMPLIWILVLHDLKSREHRAGRYALLEASVNQSRYLWATRASVKVAGLVVCLLLPLLIGGVVTGTAWTTLLLASSAVTLYGLCWLVISLIVLWFKPAASSAVSLFSLLSVWMVTAVLIPAGAQLAINQAVPVPASAEILLLQRETVNDAWDLPKADTLSKFAERHPEWQSYKHNGQGFDWPWYYAFQQVGDQQTEALSQAYHQGRLSRDQLAQQVAWLAPPVLLERVLQQLADTDLQASLAYEAQVRRYHEALRQYYYPKLFQQQAFDLKSLNPPDFKP